MTRLNPRDFCSSWLRSFALQASWNYEQMQSLGFLYTLVPILRRLYPEDLLPAVYRRHLQYFNTHPYLASALIGAVAKLEQQAAAGEPKEIGIQEFKSAVTPPFAAMGDSFFWGALRPAASTAGLFLAFRGSFWGPLLALFLFNLPHLWLRIYGFHRGYRRGFRVVENVQRCRLPDLALRLKQLLVILLGILAAWLIGGQLQGQSLFSGWALLALPLVWVLGFLIRKRIGPLTLLFSMLMALLAWFQWI
ncbi:MAG: PTS system mannose/fructose/sorbose family transporter subunit IID [Syntrophotaleaceae bacterium]